jgi:hypothetical protein
MFFGTHADGRSMWRYSLVAIGLLGVIASGFGAKHHRRVTAAPRLRPAYSVGQVKAAFADEGVSLSVVARDHGTVMLMATTPDFTDSINVQVGPRLQHRGRILVVVPGGHRLVWARNVAVDFDPTSQLGVKARAAVARLRRMPKG